MNIVKYRGGCFTGDPSTYRNRKYDISKENNQKNNEKKVIAVLVLSFKLKEIHVY